MSDWARVRLHVVTGKGGTGKTTVAAALAMALARDGRKVLLCEVEGRQGIARLFDVEPLPYEERLVAVAPGDGEVRALAIDAEAALLEYLDMYYRLGRAGRALDRFGVIDFATTIAPGVRDVLLTGKVFEAYRRRQRAGPPVYDHIVLDAPPTGRIARFLNVNAEVAGIAKVGPIRKQADSIMQVLQSRGTAVHLVTLLEDMPVQETADAITELSAAELSIGGIVVNQARSTPLTATTRKAIATGSLGAAELLPALKTAGLDDLSATPGTVADGLLAGAVEHVERLDLEERLLADVEALGRPVYRLPQLSDGMDLAGLYELADALCEQAMA
ncbi:ArsA-related P-loop ATPase [soil metagenome]